MATEAKHADAPKDDALKTIKDELRAFQIERRSARNRLVRFQRNHRFCAKHLPQHAKESTDQAKEGCVKLTYQLLRTFCFAYNNLHSAKDAEKFAIPADFEAELKEVLTDKYYSGFSNAIKATKEEYKTQLPADMSGEVCERLLKFVSVKEKDHIITKYESQINDLSAKITDKTKERDAIQPPRPKPEKKDKKDQPKEKRQRQRRDSKNSSESESTSLEDRLHGIL